jgi:subtilisin-like proprotein convertase family protein
MVSGVAALMLEANSTLTWRDVKHVLAATAVQVDTSFAATAVNTIDYVAWVTNSAGFKFHPWYGFGAVDAKAAIDAAVSHTLLTSHFFTSWNLSTVESTSMSDQTIYSRSLTEVGAGTVEHVRVAFKIGHSVPSHLGFRLESPSGTISALLPPVTTLTTALSTATWVYLSSNAFYGEDKAGVWKLHIVDHITGTTGTFARWGVHFMYR